MLTQTISIRKCALAAVSVLFLAIGSFPFPALASASPNTQITTVALSLEPSSLEVAKGDTFSVDIVVATGDQTITGINAFIDFDHTLLEVQDSDSNKSGVQILGGGNFAVEHENAADNASGEINFRAGSSSVVDDIFVLATITFRALDVTSSTGTDLTFSTSSFPRITFPQGPGGALPSDLSNSNVKISETDISIAKTASPSPTVIAGESITYTITVSNNGPSDATGVFVNDPIPAGASFVSAEPSTGSGDYDHNGGIWSVGDLVNGTSASLMLSVKVDSSANGPIINTATVNSQFDPNTDNNSVTVQTAVDRLADLKLDINSSPNPVMAGNLLVYGITVTNDGPSDAAAVTVTKSIPSQVSIQSASADFGTFDTVTGVWDVGDLNAGESGELSVTAIVHPSTDKDSIVSSSVTVDSDTPDPQNENDSAMSEVAVSTSADLLMEKAASASSVAAGEQVSYTVNVTNNGPSDASQVSVADTLPNSLSFISASTSVGDFDDQSGVWTVGDMSDGQSASMTMVVAVASDVEADVVIENSANATTLTSDSNQSNNIATAPVQITTSADLRLEKVADVSTAIADRDQITYTITVINEGPSDATDIEIVESMPDEVSIESFSVDAGSFDERTGIWEIDDLAAGEFENLQIVVLIDPGVTEDKVLENSVTVSSSTPDPDGGNNSAGTGVQLVTTVDLGIEVASSPDPAIAGDNVTYVFEVTNDGPSNASDVEVFVSLPGEMIADSFTLDVGEFNAQTGLWNVGELFNGQSARLDVAGSLDAATPEGSVIIGSASLVTSTPDSDDSNDSATLMVDVIARADLEVDKSADIDAVVAGLDQITYSTTVVNNGPSDALDVLVTDLMPDQLNIESIARSRGDFNESTGDWTIGLLPSKQSANISIVASVSLGTPDGTNLINQAAVSSSTVDPDLSNNSGTVGVTVEREADISISKEADLDTVVAGGLLTYTITVTNNGPDAASSITVSDDLPEGTTFNADSSSEGCAAEANTTKCNINELLPTQSATLNIAVDVDSAMPHDSTLSNTAHAGSVQVDRNQSNDLSNAVMTRVEAKADLSISQKASPSQAIIGSQLSYTITVSNAGPSDATEVVVVSTLPEQVEFVSASSAGFDDSTGIWSVGTLPVNLSVTLTILVNVPVSTVLNTPLVNSVSTNGAQEDDNPVNNSHSLQTPVTVATDLSITSQDSIDPVVAGNEVTYTFIVSNSGPSIATGVVVTYIPPAGITFVSDNPSQGSFDSQSGVWEIGSLGVGKSQLIELTVLVSLSTSGMIVHRAQVSAEQPDQVETNNLVIESTQVAAALDTASASVSPQAGAIVDTGSGDDVEASVEIPANVLNETIKISVQTISSKDTALPPLPDMGASLSRAVSLSPNGQQFNAPVTIGIKYSDRDAVGLDENTFVPLLLEAGSWAAINETCPEPLTVPLDPCLSERRPSENLLIIKSTHFSLFAVQASTIKVVTIQSEGEAKRGDSYFVAVSASGKFPEASDGTPLTPIEDVSEVLLKMHGLDRIGGTLSTHVLFAAVPDTAPKGLMPIEVDLGDGTSLSANLNVVSARTNRNFYLFPGMNFTGLGLLPDETMIDNLLDQPVTNVNAELGGLLGRTVTLADVVSRVFAYDEVEDTQGNRAATFFINHTTHPCGSPTAACHDPSEGITPADSLTEAQPYQGMVIETRTKIFRDSQGQNPLNVFEMIHVERLQMDVAVPVKLNVKGSFLNLDLIDNEGTPSTPMSITKELHPGFNLIAPHISEVASFDQVFSGALEPNSLAERALTTTKRVRPLRFGSLIGLDYDEDVIAISGNQAVEPEFSYWIYIKNFLTQDGVKIVVRPVITPLVP